MGLSKKDKKIAPGVIENGLTTKYETGLTISTAYCRDGLAPACKLKLNEIHEIFLCKFE